MGSQVLISEASKMFCEFLFSSQCVESMKELESWDKYWVMMLRNLRDIWLCERLLVLFREPLYGDADILMWHRHPPMLFVWAWSFLWMNICGMMMAARLVTCSLSVFCIDDVQVGVGDDVDWMTTYRIKKKNLILRNIRFLWCPQWLTGIHFASRLCSPSLSNIKMVKSVPSWIFNHYSRQEILKTITKTKK